MCVCLHVHVSCIFALFDTFSLSLSLSLSLSRPPPLCLMYIRCWTESSRQPVRAAAASGKLSYPKPYSLQPTAYSLNPNP